MYKTMLTEAGVTDWDETFSNDSYEEGEFFPDYDNSDDDSFEGIPILFLLTLRRLQHKKWW